MVTLPASNAVGFRSERGPVLLALMLSTGLIAIDATILATAVPSVVKELGSFEQFPWLFSVYLLAQAVSVPIYSKLADTVGRKPIILVGIGLFLLGSILCGAAWSMPALIAFRAIQGLGAGAVAPMSMTIVGDIYTVAERAKVQGYIASVWAIASVVGPALGGVFSQFTSWRWIFFVNIPLCLIAAFMILRSFHEQVERKPHKLDWLGSALLTAGLTLVILGLLEGGHAWAWGSWQTIAIFAVGAAALVAFAFAERRAAEPVLDLSIFSRRLISSTTLVSIGVGAILIGITSYIPTYLEGSIRVVPLVSGAAVAALTLGWPLAATLAGRMYLALGFRTTVLIGATIALAGTIALALISPYPNPWTIGATAFVIGFGLGWVAAPSLIAAQSSVGWSERGVVTGTNAFARSAGSAVGVAVFGAIANAIFTATPNGEQVPSVVEAAGTAVFVGVAVTTALMLLAGLAMPRVRAEDLVAADPRAESAG
ncbi:MFS transporter [Agromyces protaetiae]|uniref:MFS transporter n=1 Tax=Agromyces protaetiae TaxID=2509455 RepID=A0A4P6FJV5_9MICO|nr:MFS transporter [Agromyces protaetiae]QAY74267.1 MFS transporter [Agromyces protaetiae]